jgi:hypothetical protein
METVRYVMADSKDRDTNLYPNGNDYYVHLSTPIKNVSRVDLVSARVPNTMYNLTVGSNVFQVGTSNVSLPIGFYSATGAADALTNTGLITVDYLANEGLFMFSNVGAFTINVPSLELSNILGITSGTSAAATSADPTYSGKQILRSTRIINLSVNDYIYLDITEFRTPSRVATGALTGTTGTITGSNAGRAFAPIIIDVSSACVKNFHEAKDYVISVYFPEPIGTLSRLHVKWYDKDGQLLNFRGLDTNAFVLRVYSPDPEIPSLPPPRIEEVELKRFIDITETFPIPKPQKRRRIPWALIVLIILAGAFVYKNYFSGSQRTLPTGAP